MSFIDIVYRILAQGYSPSEYGGAGILVAMLASMVLSIYIYLCYRMLHLQIKVVWLKSLQIFLCGQEFVRLLKALI